MCVSLCLTITAPPPPPSQSRSRSGGNVLSVSRSFVVCRRPIGLSLARCAQPFSPTLCRARFRAPFKQTKSHSDERAELGAAARTRSSELFAAARTSKVAQKNKGDFESRQLVEQPSSIHDNNTSLREAWAESRQVSQKRQCRSIRLNS